MCKSAIDIWIMGSIQIMTTKRTEGEEGLRCYTNVSCSTSKTARSKRAF